MFLRIAYCKGGFFMVATKIFCLGPFQVYLGTVEFLRMFMRLLLLNANIHCDYCLQIVQGCSFGCFVIAQHFYKMKAIASWGDC